jgi:hypothetical protein
MGEGPKVHVIRVRHYNADIEQPALDMSLARGGIVLCESIATSCLQNPVAP